MIIVSVLVIDYASWEHIALLKSIEDGGELCPYTNINPAAFFAPKEPPNSNGPPLIDIGTFC